MAVRGRVERLAGVLDQRTDSFAGFFEIVVLGGGLTHVQVSPPVRLKSPYYIIDIMEDERLMKVTQKGQTTIPKDLRDAFEIDAPGRVTMEATDEGILIKRVPTPAELTGELASVTDDEGRSGVEALREERRADARAEEQPRGIYE